MLWKVFILRVGKYNPKKTERLKKRSEDSTGSKRGRVLSGTTNIEVPCVLLRPVGCRLQKRTAVE